MDLFERRAFSGDIGLGEMSVISNSLIVQSLTHTQQTQLAEKLAEDLTVKENVDGLLSVLEALPADDEVLDTVSKRVTSFFICALTNESELFTLENVMYLLLKLPTTSKSVLSWIQNRIVSVLHTRKTLVFPKDAFDLFIKQFDIESTSSDGLEASDVSLVHLLSFLEELFSHESIEVPISLDKLVIMMLTMTDETITTRATKVIRWRDTSIEPLHETTWDVIFLLCRSSQPPHTTAAFILWLRFLIDMPKKSITCTRFNSEAQKDVYWNFIQTGLTSSTHEHRKYCLSILKLTLQQLTVDVDNSLITLSMSKRSDQIEEWKRFATLYEIIGVDTALNQALAAHDDLVQLLSPNSAIKPSWGMALLCTGFKGSMEAVRKYSLEVMLSVPKSDLSNFAHPFLTEIFLNYALEGSHFQVKKNGDFYRCDYGERLELFIASVLKSLKKDHQRLLETVTKLLELLADITAIYAPSRIYLANGVLKGLKGQQILEEKHITHIYRLFESTAEDDVFSTMLQTVHLRLLKHLKSNVPLLVESLTRFVQFNGYAIYRENIEIFLDYASTYHDGSDIPYKGRQPEYQVVHYSLFNVFLATDDFLIELANSGLDIDSQLSLDYSSLLTRLLKGDFKTYQKVNALSRLGLFMNSWRSVNLEHLYRSLLSSMTVDKFDFFSEVFTKVADVTDVTSFTLTQVRELHSKVQSTLTSKNFKIKDQLSGFFLRTLLAFLKMTPLSDPELTTILTILHSELKNGTNIALTASCQILQFLLRNYDSLDLITVVEMLEATWDHITGDRLTLAHREMHMCVIETIFDERLLKDSINNEYHANVLCKIGLDVIQLGLTRRCLLPCLARKLKLYQEVYGVEFEQIGWVRRLILALVVSVQEDSNMFTIKHVIAKKFDEELSFGEEMYAQSYGDREVSAKVHSIAMLTNASGEFCEEYAKLAMGDDYSFLVAERRANGTEELQRVFAFASLLLVSRKISSEALADMSLKLMPLLETETSPWVRAYMEWIIAIDLVKNAKDRQAVFTLFQDQGKPVLVTSAERIAFLVSQKLHGEEAAEYFDTFTKYLIPNCASNKPLVRHFSNSLMLSLYPEIQSKNIQLPVDGILKMLYDEALKSAVTGKYRTGDALLWDVETDFNLVGIFGGVLSRISMRELVEIITEKDFRDYMVGDSAVPIGATKLANWAGSLEKQKESRDSKSRESSPLQTKSGAWEAVLDIDENMRNVKRSELIVVSSLVDKPPNLGGICRLCDVLGAGLMTVDDLRVKKHPAFKSVAVTADYWMPMEEVNIGNIASFMRQKKKEGYTLIGLEQTDQSVVLGKDTQFPSKSLFLLGKEAEGIPGDLLPELDFCVEIRQAGVIRSMNIQTATAVLVHAYSSAMNL